ncbi:hypothetical protein V5799_032484 [Amblyomma americanum]|uniref:TIR domain-containing protein n=1 Tax=Amblyomma americanum TaxID=6943 RepID=A0AAQ4DR22_AMBAM
MCSLRVMYGSPFFCLSHLKTLELYNNELTTLSAENFEGLTSLKKLNLAKNMIVISSPSSIFSPLLSLDILHLRENKVDVLFPEIFVNLNVKTLSLSSNAISNWSQPIFSRMAKLVNLLLDSNKIRVLDDTMYKDVADLPSINICNNPWDCTSCSIRNVERLLFRPEKQVCCDNCVVCSGDKGPMANTAVKSVLPSTEACRLPDYYVIVGVPVVLAVLMGSVTGYAVYVNRWYIRYFALFLRVKVQGYRRLKSGEPFLWDAFVSYHNSDADWVRDCVVPTLESSTLRFRVCIGERDFIPGMPIVENVYRAIAQSRKSLFVLSRDFCASRWCTFELTLAQHRLFESDRENQMVFILREEIADSEMCSLLKYLTKTRTYVQVPPVESDASVKDFFWLQLRAALEF